MRKKFDYDWLNNNTSHHHYLIKSIKNILKDKKTKFFNHLDVGCGNGFLTKSISLFFKKTLGIDLSAEGIRQANMKSKKTIKFKNISIDQLKKNKKKFNFITCFEVIEHQYLPDDFLKSIYNLMEKDGYLLLSTPYNGYIKNLIISLLNKNYWHYNPLWRHGHIKFFSTKTMKKILQECHFKIKEIKYSGRFYPLSCSMIFLCQKND